MVLESIDIRFQLCFRSVSPDVDARHAPIAPLHGKHEAITASRTAALIILSYRYTGVATEEEDMRHLFIAGSQQSDETSSNDGQTGLEWFTCGERRFATYEPKHTCIVTVQVIGIVLLLAYEILERRSGSVGGGGGRKLHKSKKFCCALGLSILNF